MRELLTLALFGVLACRPFVSTAASSVELTAESAEIVVATNACPVVRFAARELKEMLGTVLGAPVPVVSAPTDGKASVVLGDCTESRVAGIDVGTMVRDGFVIRVRGGRIFIAGRDDPRRDPVQTIEQANYWAFGYELATVFGAYEFLERFADCRFFFPGEFGTILPRADRVRVPECDLAFKPDFTARDLYLQGDGAWYDPTVKPTAGKALDWLRLRMETERIPCCHGQNQFMLVERFGKSHPEYFQLKKDGTRCTEYANAAWFDDWRCRQLCHTSRVWDEIYEDAKAYLTGRPASSRGVMSQSKKGDFAWNANCVGGKYVDIMPQDGLTACECPTCQAAYDKGVPDYAAELIWGNTARLAKRLKDEGVPGTVTQMAYHPYRAVPKCELTDNILAVVAQNGPWIAFAPGDALQKEVALYRAWSEKTHRRVQTWTYPHKYGKTRIPGVPCMAPRAHGRYWKAVAPYITGGFLESESERAIYQYLNYYVFSKLAWDPGLDVEVLLDDHFAHMFGKGAAPMARLYDEMERKWIGEIAANIRETQYGPESVVPSTHEIWTRVYSPETITGWGRLCDEALEAVGSGSPESRRVEFIRREFVLPLAEESRRYFDSISVEKALAARAAAPARSVVRNGDFESMDGWRVESGSVELDRDVKVTGSASVKLTSDGGRVAFRQDLGEDFKPGTKYRVSFFVKLGDVRPTETKGSHSAYVEFFDDDWVFFPKDSKLDGTVDWMHQSYEFSTKARRSEKPRFVHLLMLGVKGTVWFDGLRVEEIR